MLTAAAVEDVEPFVGEQRLSTITPMFHDSADDTLFVAVAPFEHHREAAFALAYGLTYAGDRELVLVLPAHLSGPSLRRCAFLDLPIRVIEYEPRTVSAAGPSPPARSWCPRGRRFST